MSIAGEFLTQPDRGSVLEMGATRLDHVVELPGFAGKRALEPAHRIEQERQRGERGEPQRGRDHVIGTLGHVDVIVGMHRRIAAPRGTQDFVGPVREHLVTVHVVAGAGARLIDIDDELLAVLAAQDFVGGAHDGIG